MIIRVFKSRSMRWARACITYGVVRSEYNIWVWKPARNRPLERLSYRWKDPIRMDLLEIEWEGVDWIHLAQDRGQRLALVNTVTNLQVP
jgi:hypothetical protein